MFLLTSSITIGDYENVKVHEAVIRTAVRNFINEASLKIPIRARVITPDDLTAKVLKTSTIFKEGMKVKIDLGYNSQNVNEFTGFIARVNFKSPIELVCEGYSYQLRKMTYPAITFTNSTVKEILQFLIKGTDIVLADVIEHIPIPKLPISGQSGVEVLRKMSDLLNNTVLFRFKNNVLSVDFFPLKEESGLVNYYVGWNVIRSDDLKKREAQNQDVEVN